MGKDGVGWKRNITSLGVFISTFTSLSTWPTFIQWFKQHLFQGFATTLALIVENKTKQKTKHYLWPFFLHRKSVAVVQKVQYGLLYLCSWKEMSLSQHTVLMALAREKDSPTLSDRVLLETSPVSEYKWLMSMSK